MKQKRNPIVQVVLPPTEHQVLQEIANIKCTSVSAVVRDLLLNAPDYQKIRSYQVQRGVIK